uniref:Late endosomal/lysosomal adaptor and MAPK and MTOR activator 5 n=1 Tax=Meloidogyne incognita TaxID=6306 RepID=A0A914N0M8_MELIC
MEKRMEECAEEIMTERNVCGVLCTDINGALFVARGTLASPDCAGVISQLANRAASQEPSLRSLAVLLSVPSNSSTASSASLTKNKSVANQAESKLLIRSNGVITIAIHLSK